MTLFLTIAVLLQTAIFTPPIDEKVASIPDTVCTYSVKCTTPSTNQYQSGNCWLFSTLNVLRAESEEFRGHQFSQPYNAYWDLYEKCRTRLYYMEKYRHRSRFSQVVADMFRIGIKRGGCFINAANVIDKYGVVPLEVMPATPDYENNPHVLAYLTSIVRKYGVKMRHARRREIPALREQALSDVRKVLDLLYGVPPTEFDWEGEHYTPMSFAAKYVKHNMVNDYVTIMNDPSLKYYRRYSIRRRRNCLDYGYWTAINVPMDVLEKIGMDVLKDGKMFYFQADCKKDNCPERGIYAHGVFRTSEALGVDLSFTKEELLESGEGHGTHCMAMCGVKLDGNGSPIYWVCENSHGENHTCFGVRRSMDEKWVQQNLYNIAVEKKYLPKSVSRLLKKKPKLIPESNPAY